MMFEKFYWQSLYVFPLLETSYSQLYSHYTTVVRKMLELVTGPNELLKSCKLISPKIRIEFAASNGQINKDVLSGRSASELPLDWDRMPSNPNSLRGNKEAERSFVEGARQTNGYKDVPHLHKNASIPPLSSKPNWIGSRQHNASIKVRGPRHKGKKYSLSDGFRTISIFSAKQ